jgi:glycosyltransferase involved in cell wall biosynthesis
VQVGATKNMSKLWRIGLVMEGSSDWVGGVEYIKNIVFAIQSLPIEVKSLVEICLICDKSLPIELYDSIVPYLTEIFYTDHKNAGLRKKIYRRIYRVLLNIKENNPQVSMFLEDNTSHKIDFLYPYFTNSKKIGEPTCIAWIGDFQHKYLPQLFTSKDIRAREKGFADIAKYAPIIVVSSESAKKDFHQFFPDSKAKIEVLSFTTFPLPEWFAPMEEGIQRKYSIPKKFFLVSNQFWQHKNHEVVFKAVSLLKKRGICINVVCTGKAHDSRNPGFSEKINAMIVSFDISNQILILGLIPKIHQVQLIRECIAMIQPSLFEGWSTVVEDARCFGKRIALSNIPVHVEQNPPDALFFDTGDPEQLADILKTLWEKFDVGFNEREESIAYQNNCKNIQGVGYKFLEILGIQSSEQES